MMDILKAPFVEEMCRTTANMYRIGWDERNGGNISYLLEEAEVAQIYMLTAHLPRVNTIRDAEMVELAEFFGVKYRKDFLDI